ncbi:hypothetical protein BCR33DRAFT_685228 [Rhizoclosmatium globosum]|uniref:FAD/NAD(P)-binding domain-containing protein n=1 Tax=Rhizoclosmatium globosum TaxID=329046 RepID=A0A1Y2B8G1_9FUNG|nr:hypothetical protein BCR33DRAFT_685228 [Rhizoclosmatium globosum]|eukprot:ORY31131.1 hypothetical protein BCR33DRAFT_685228 [Rhizoclosmatium globosum]
MQPTPPATPSASGNTRYKIGTTKNDPLRIAVVGLGPTGANHIVCLIDKLIAAGRTAEITAYDNRILTNSDGSLRWRNEQDNPPNWRRQQVITLQEANLALLNPEIQAEFVRRQNGGDKTGTVDRVWPTSNNVPIAIVEDIYLEFLQRPEYRSMITFKTDRWDTDSFDYDAYDVLVGADGSMSAVRHALYTFSANVQQETISIGFDHALGVAFNIPPPHEPINQSLGVLFTVAQTRYLVNDLNGRQGFLNIRVSVDEYNMLESNRVNYSSMPDNSELKQVVEAGLKMYGIPPEFVTTVARIPINMTFAPYRFRFRGQCAVCLVGDAAMRVNFWPGRGANSGLLASIALANVVVDGSRRGRQHEIIAPVAHLIASDEDDNRPRYSFFLGSHFVKFESFMGGLICREQNGRSQYITDIPVDDAVQVAAESIKREGGKLTVARVNGLRSTFKARVVGLQDGLIRGMGSQWVFPLQDPALIGQVVDRIPLNAMRLLEMIPEWPTRSMAGNRDDPSELLASLLPAPQAAQPATPTSPVNASPATQTAPPAQISTDNTLIEALIPAAEADDRRSQFQLAEAYSKRNNTERANHWYVKSANQGYPDAQVALGIQVESQDPVKAAQWYRKAADQGNAAAQYRLGLCYRSGAGVPRDYVEALRLFRLSADQKNAFGEFRVGCAYEHGQGVETDLKTAVDWFTLAAERGNSDAQVRLGFCYQKGLGVPKSYKSAFLWYSAAAAQNHSWGQNGLGYCYEFGRHVPQDMNMAMDWYRKSASHGNPEAKASLDRLKSQSGK